MKEIKAYIKITAVEGVVQALFDAGFQSMSVIDVTALGNFINPDQWEYSMEVVQKSSKVAKLELDCADGDVPRVVEIIQKSACSNQAGDGIILVAPIERAVKIRTGQEGEQILQT